MGACVRGLYIMCLSLSSFNLVDSKQPILGLTEEFVGWAHASGDGKGDQPSDGETTWTNTGATRSGRGQHKTG